MYEYAARAGGLAQAERWFTLAADLRFRPGGGQKAQAGGELATGSESDGVQHRRNGMKEVTIAGAVGYPRPEEEASTVLDPPRTGCTPDVREASVAETDTPSTSLPLPRQDANHSGGSIPPSDLMTFRGPLHVDSGRFEHRPLSILSRVAETH